MKKVVRSLLVALVVTMISSQNALAMQWLSKSGFGDLGNNLDSFTSERLNATTGDGITIHLDNNKGRLLFSDSKMIQFSEGSKFMFIWNDRAYLRNTDGKWSSIDLNTRQTNSLVSKYSGVLSTDTVTTEKLRLNSTQIEGIR